LQATAGTQSVSPTVTTTYTLACNGTGGTATSSATVNVAHIFGVGARVMTVASTTVHATPKGTVLGSQLVGASGTIIGGPYITGEGTNPWWQVDFDSGVDGWVKQSYLTVL
jgi:hypothetical protein